MTSAPFVWTLWIIVRVMERLVILRDFACYWTITMKINRIFRHHLWWYQRITRGYSDRDMWSADYFLAGQIAGMLNWIVDKGMGVSMAYAAEDDPYAENIEDMVARRDADYLFYASIFDEYSKNGPALNEDWQEKFGGVLDSDLKEALQWFSEHFTEFWD